MLKTVSTEEGDYREPLIITGTESSHAVSESGVAKAPHNLNALFEKLAAAVSLPLEAKVKCRAEVLRPLTELLWELTPADAYLDAVWRKALRIELAHAVRRDDLTETESDFLVAVCKVLTVVGDGKAIPVLESWERTWPRSANARPVHVASREFLPLLKAEAARRESSRKRLSEFFDNAIEKGVYKTDLEDALTRMGPDIARHALRELLDKRIRQKIRSDKIGESLLVLPPLLYILLMGNVILSSYASGKTWTLSFTIQSLGVWSALSLSLGINIWLYLYWLRSLMHQKVILFTPDYSRLSRVATVLSRYATKQDAGRLLMAWHFCGPIPEVTDALVRVLNELEPDDVALLPAPAREYLRHLQAAGSEKLPEKLYLAVSRLLSAVESSLPPGDPCA